MELDLSAALPAQLLRPYVTSYTGFRFSGLDPGVLRGLPSRTVTVIVMIDDTLTVGWPDDDRVELPAMTSGLHTTPALIGHRGHQHGVQLELTPIGALALLGAWPGELANDLVDLGQLDQRLAGQLVDRLGSVSNWSDRFAALDQLLGARLERFERSRRRSLPAPVARAWRILDASDGRVAVTDVAREVGWSSRHLADRFGHSFGVSPKEAARIMRFERARELLAAQPALAISAVAAASGFADQAHLTREWKRLTATTPQAWRREQLRFVQDQAARQPSG